MKAVLLGSAALTPAKAAVKAAKAKHEQDLKTAVTAAAKTLVSGAPTIGAVDGKTYEAWVMLELAVAFATRPTPLSVQVCDNGGTVVSALRVADGPRFLTGLAFDPKAGGFIRVGAVRPREIHNSLRHKGKSPSDHELDVAIIDANTAQDRRKAGGGVMLAKPDLGLELKDYAPPKALNKNIARALIGVALDLGGAPRDMAAYQHRPGRFALLTPTALTRPTADLLRYYDVLPAPGTTPPAPTLSTVPTHPSTFSFLASRVPE